MSWVIAAKTTDNPRDCRFVTLAGILPDVDGLGLIPDVATRALAYRGTLYYEHCSRKRIMVSAADRRAGRPVAVAAPGSQIAAEIFLCQVLPVYA